MRNITFRLRCMFSTSENVFAKYNQFREVARFQSQNITWSVEEIETHGNAIARGLRSLGVSKGDTLLLRMPEQLQTEIVATQLGASKLGVKLQRSTATNDDEVVQELERFSAAGLIFDPAHIGQKFNQSLELNKGRCVRYSVLNGEKLQVSKLPKLKFLAQTGSYSMRGVYKFKNILNYATEIYSPGNFDELKPEDIPSGTQPIIVTDVYSNHGLRAGLFNALYNNRFVIYAHHDSSNFKLLTANIPKAYVIGSNISDLPYSYIKLDNRLADKSDSKLEENKPEDKQEKKEENNKLDNKQNVSTQTKPQRKVLKESSTQTKNKPKQ